jgi:hypothetical protein
MADLRLAKLTDRTEVKLAIQVTPDLHQALTDYAAPYAQSYDREEAIADLVPAMLVAFLDSNRGFAKARQNIEQRS